MTKPKSLFCLKPISVDGETMVHCDLLCRLGVPHKGPCQFMGDKGKPWKVPETGRTQGKVPNVSNTPKTGARLSRCRKRLNIRGAMARCHVMGVRHAGPCTTKDGETGPSWMNGYSAPHEPHATRASEPPIDLADLPRKHPITVTMILKHPDAEVLLRAVAIHCKQSIEDFVKEAVKDRINAEVVRLQVALMEQGMSSQAQQDYWEAFSNKGRVAKTKRPVWEE